MSPRPRVAVNKYLLPREVLVATVRFHPVVMFPAAAEAFAGLVVVITLSATLVHGQAQSLLLLVPAALLWLRLIMVVLGWSVSYFTLTAERVMTLSGFFRRTMTVTPLHELVGVAVHRSFPGRLIGFGDLVIPSGGRYIVIASFLPYPEQLYLLLTDMLYPRASEYSDSEN
jgi:uncharacterized membrane protein YdbT with pleckstrin-like domain